jgi:Protein of unknown function (DUF4239)
VRLVVPLEELEANHTVGGIIFAVFGTAYAVLLSFVIVISWTQLSNANQAVSREAADLGSLFWLVHGFPNGEATVRTTIGRYAQAVIDEEWPLMARGGASADAWGYHDDLWNSVYALQPSTEQVRAQYGAQYAQVLVVMSSIEEDRRARLVSAQASVPSILWVMLIGGGALLIPYTYLFGTRRIAPQAFMTGGLAAMVSLSLVLVAVLGHPYAGAVRVDPAPFQSVVTLTKSSVDP